MTPPPWKSAPRSVPSGNPERDLGAPQQGQTLHALGVPMLGVSASARTLGQKRVLRGGAGHFLLQAQAQLHLSITTPRAAGSSCSAPQGRGGGRKQSRSGARVSRLPHEWEHSVGERGLSAGRPQASCLPQLPGTGHHRGSPSLCLRGDRGLCKQSFVHVRLQEPRVGVL